MALVVPQILNEVRSLVVYVLVNSFVRDDGESATHLFQSSCDLFRRPIFPYFANDIFPQIQIIFDDECESSVNWAFSIEGDSLGVLEYWDEETKLDYCPPTSPEELRFALV